jgi:S-adenosylmethionine hydrolase
LLLPAAERAGITEVRELANPGYALETISRTFHGRDLFAPRRRTWRTACTSTELGPPLDPDALVRLDLRGRLLRRSIDATTLYVDSFGNIA